MSSFLYPTDMFPSYNNNLPQGGSKSCKAVGINSFQTGNMAQDRRPYWNKDYTNDTRVGFGKPRPLKQFRKGRVISDYQQVNIDGNLQIIDVNELRYVKSSVQNNNVNQMLWIPGGYNIKSNSPTEIGNFEESVKNCINCKATTVVSNWKPTTNLTEKPQINVTSPLLCCNEEKKAKLRVRPASTIYNRYYYADNQQYLQNRCQTFKQRQFNFIRASQIIQELKNEVSSGQKFTSSQILENSKPGGPLSEENLYVSQCLSNNQINQTDITVLINNLILGMLNNTLISQSEYVLLNSMSFTSIQPLVLFIGTNFSSSRSLVLGDYMFGVINSNKDLSELVGDSNGMSCPRVYYKPNNPSFGVQGGVSASARILQLNKEVIEKAYWSNRANYQTTIVQNENLNLGTNIVPNTAPFFDKAKFGSSCYKTICSNNKNQPTSIVEATPIIGV